jgi:PIN domain nuclease of toxin-antitoxin system
MSYLLDTHAYLWWTLDHPRLSHLAREIIEDAQSDVFLSVASIWEIATKHAIGKLTLRAPLARVVIDEPDRNGIKTLDVSREHACRTAELPLLHRDPFDRMLVAQAQVEDLDLITRDPAVSAYAVRVIW